WRIDIKSVTEAVTEALESLDSLPLREIRAQQSDVVAEVQRIMEKRAANRAVMPEEYNLLARFADMVQRSHVAVRDAARQARLKEIEAVKATLPQGAFKLPVTVLDVPDNVIEALQPFENVGEIMLRFLIDENRVRRALTDSPPDAFRNLQEALDKLVIPEVEPEVEEEAEPVVEGEAEAPAVAAAPPADETPEEALVRQAAEEARRQKRPREEVVGFVEEEDVDVLAEGSGKKKGKKKKGRQLVFDEKRGGMVVKRQRKGGRGGDWGNWDEE
ncbi:MAG: hypothetical protein IT319_19935, partial [Anaerolineae bacterium]|nr:hypothetical protein [Anaerolineae bacterium]